MVHSLLRIKLHGKKMMRTFAMQYGNSPHSVDADCKKFSKILEINQTRVSKTVDVVTFTKDGINDIDEDKDSVVLGLSEPFELNERVNTIKLLSDNNIDDYDPSNCFTYHWRIVYNKKESQGGLIVEEYRASLADDGTFKINKEDEVNEIPYDLDCVASPCAYFQNSVANEPSDLNFLGSPVVCPLKSNPDQFIQAGFATNLYRLYLNETTGDKKKYEHVKGNLVDFFPLQKEFHYATDHAFDN
ncbi:uncharacterized protein LOC130674226 [Microplitis mediator]|uniref:uncharacterized protein LOC130674226 n=1 Tax=Microplitis mediator TaxID=375433 RepID=UPI00255798B1|nr:uncharacterized protein LOC130674226 [Microplitis mediator]